MLTEAVDISMLNILWRQANKLTETQTDGLKDRQTGTDWLGQT